MDILLIILLPILVISFLFMLTVKEDERSCEECLNYLKYEGKCWDTDCKYYNWDDDNDFYQRR